MKNVMKNYYKPTPKKWRRIGDTILAVGTAITAGALIEFEKLEKIFSAKELKIIIAVAFGLAVAGKFLTNFFKEETKEISTDQ
jgi:S-adenosylmethionine:tRNA-ribosyltransferase-isomerase (queuine synthetase)